jgi:copper homeostasis protein CutC
LQRIPENQDIKAAKGLGLEQIIFGLMGMESDKVIDTAKELSRFAR